MLLTAWGESGIEPAAAEKFIELYLGDLIQNEEERQS
jgi:hypothetical protein